jgi:hypothetical protein
MSTFLHNLNILTMRTISLVLLMILGATTGLRAQSPVVEVTSDIIGFALWERSNVYLIKGTIYVKSGLLLIEPGTVIKGDKATKGTLVVTRTGQINANSVLDKDPAIVFTSSEPEGSRAPGDWGGVIILGQAPINAGASATLAAVNNGAGDGQYGGSSPTHISGSLQKVRIEYAGAPLIGGTRLGGLTLAGVGSGTTLRNVQVTNCAADGFDIRGGTVNMSNVVSHRNADDDFDLTQGYSGRMQFVVGIRDNANVNGASGANGLEADNDASGSTATPFTSATISNMTLIGPKQTLGTSVDADFENGIRIGGNARVGIYNSVVMGYPTGLNLDGAGTQNAATAGNFDIRDLFIAGADNELAASGGWDISTWFDEAGRRNTLYDVNDSIQLNGPFDLNFPLLRPAETSPLVGAGRFDVPALTDFNPVSYAGAFSRLVNWTLCWTNWNPTNTNYDSGSELLASPISISFEYRGRPEGDSLTVDFTNLTTGAERYFWDFGDASTDADTSSLESPTYTYPSAGSYEVRLRATGPCDNQDSVSVNTFIGLGLSNWFSGADITLFPNPASHTLWLDMDLPRSEEIQLLLFDLSGRLLRDYGTLEFPAGQFRYTASLDGLESGLYMLVLNGPGGVHTEKVQIIR